MAMKLSRTDIPEVIIIEPRVFEDSRGFFMETYSARQFAEAGIVADFVQDNHSYSIQATLRGLHYQIRHAQGKLVWVVAGEIYDVVADIRRSSPAFGKWVGVYLSDRNKSQLWAPPGFAHGFYVVSASAEVVYKTTDYYDQAAERCIKWDDPTLNVTWPIASGTLPVLSPKDLAGNLLADAELYE
jgi:dTDP-4-dehydrorhamnose 3,5-epimerase